MLLASFHTVTAMGDCQNHNAICIFNGRLQGTILFREKQGFGCSNDQGMLLDINLEGLDLGDKVTPVNFRVKSFAGLGPNCGGMGADYGSNSRSADLGTFSARGDRLLLTDVTVRTPESMLAGGNSLFGRSVAVIKAGPQQSTEILDCCVIGMVSLQSPASDNTRYIPTQRQDTPDTTNTLDNNNTPFSGSPSGFPAGGSALPGAGSSPSFSGSSFRSPFHLDGKMDFFDLSGKTSRVHSFSHNSLDGRFKAPQAPRFQDIYGLDTGASPLSGSGYGNTVGPSRGSSLSRLFFNDGDVRDTLNVRLSPEEKDIPRESSEEEYSRSFHEDRAVDQDPGYNDTVASSKAGYGQEEGVPGGDSVTEGGAGSVESPPAGYDDRDPDQSSSQESYPRDLQSAPQDPSTTGDQHNALQQKPTIASPRPEETDTTSDQGGT
ncbi:hypothetical protein ACOMHN_010280 [Nucella lapillus]